MDWALFWFVAICFVLTLIALDNWERISAWARKRFSTPVIDIGRRRAKATVSAPVTASGHIRPTKPDSGPDMAHKQIKWGQWLGELGAFVWKAKWALLILALFIAGMSLVGAFDFGKSKDTLRAERDAALVDKTVAEHEADLGATAVELAEETHADTARVRDVVARAEEELADAVELADFDALWSAYDRAYRGVWSLDPGEDFPDPPAGRPDSLRGAGADLA